MIKHTFPYKYLCFNHNTFLEPLCLRILSSFIENTMTTWFADKTVSSVDKDSFNVSVTLLCIRKSLFVPYFVSKFPALLLPSIHSQKSDMVICTQVLAFFCTQVLAFSFHKHFGRCSKTFKSIQLMVTFFSETSTHRLNPDNLETLIALQNYRKWILLHFFFFFDSLLLFVLAVRIYTLVHLLCEWHILVKFR